MEGGADLTDVINPPNPPPLPPPTPHTFSLAQQKTNLMEPAGND